MQTLQDRIAELMSAAKLTVGELADIAGVTSSAATQWKDGPTKTLKAAPAARISARTGFSALWLSSGEGPKMVEKNRAASNATMAPIGARRVPVISAIQAGLWGEIVDHFQPGDADDWLLTDLELSPSSFALTIRGDSMLPEFREGDRVIIDPDVAPHPGDFVAAKNSAQEATFKKYRPRGMDASGHMVFELVPLNDDYPTLRSDVDHIRIVGTMVEHRKYRRPR